METFKVDDQKSEKSYETCKTNNLPSIRQQVITAFEKLFNNCIEKKFIQEENVTDDEDIHKKSRLLEKSIYNQTIKYCTDKDVNKSWDNLIFTKMYNAFFNKVYQNLDPESKIKNTRLINRLFSNEFKPQELITMEKEQLFPQHWKPYIDAKTKRDRMLYEIREEQISDAYTCSRCHQNKCTYYQLQTRSADEPITTFVNCVNCGKRWRC